MALRNCAPDADVPYKMPPRTPGSLAVIVMAVVIILTVLGRPAPTAAGAVARIDEGFETSQWHQSWSGWAPGRLNNAALAPSVDGSALTVTIPEGSHYGSRFTLPLANSSGIAPDEMYFRYDFRLSEDWGRDGTGKLPGPAGLYSTSAHGGRPPTEDSPGWSARVGFGPGPVDGTTRLSYYVYHLDQPGQFGEGFPFGGGGVVRNGEWYCLEGRVRMNTPGTNDGILEAWIDGQQVMGRDDMAFRRVGEEVIGVRSFWFNVYFGGTRTAPSSKDATFDNVAVGPARIGCGNAVGQVATGDLTGDGRSDLVTLAECDTGLCWNVEQGDPVNVGPLVQSGVDNRLTWGAQRFGFVSDDFDGDGHDDVAYWGRCRAAQGCWTVQRGSDDGLAAAEGWGSRAILDDADQDIGLASGDVDGDGRADLVYLAPCDTGKCWTVQLSTGSGFHGPASWGAGTFRGPSTAEFGLMTGDTDGDGRDDLIYAGKCGSPGVECWRVHRSTGTSFGRGEPWGLLTELNEPIGEFGVNPADVDGDGRDDLIYLAECEISQCWRALISNGTIFRDHYWGSTIETAAPASDVPAQVGDLDGDQVDDLVIRSVCGGDPCWQVLVSSRSGFTTIDNTKVVDVVNPLPAISNRFQFGNTGPTLE